MAYTAEVESSPRAEGGKNSPSKDVVLLFWVCWYCMDWRWGDGVGVVGGYIWCCCRDLSSMICFVLYRIERE